MESEKYTHEQVAALISAERARCAAAARAEELDATECGNHDAADAARRIIDAIERGPSPISAPAGED